MKIILKRAVPFGFSDILAMIYGNIDVAILSFVSIKNTGLYSPASGIIHALFIIPNSIYVYLLPKYSKEITKGNKKYTQNSFLQILAIFTFVGITLNLLLLFGGELGVTLLLGPEYASTGYLLKILSPIMLFKSISFGLALIIIISGNQKKRLLPQLIVSLFNIAFNILLIPYFGLVSVAWIYTISELLLMIGYSIIVIRDKKNEKK
jgi:O-antigen/teichoic acid export membrane protein